MIVVESLLSREAESIATSLIRVQIALLAGATEPANVPLAQWFHPFVPSQYRIYYCLELLTSCLERTLLLELSEV